MNPGIRIGTGFDAHRFVHGRKLMLGGVHIPHDMGLDGHSDADVLIHAVCDALLGAAGMGDIGKLVPDTDMQYKDMASERFLREVAVRLEKAGWAIGNIDSVLICQKPKLSPHYRAMEASMASILSVPAGSVSVKASTTEGLDDVGKGLGIVCQASALIYAL